MNEPLRRDRERAEHLRRLEERQRDGDDIVLRGAHGMFSTGPSGRLYVNGTTSLLFGAKPICAAARDVGRRDDDRHRTRQLVGLDHEHLLKHEDAERVLRAHVDVAAGAGAARVATAQVGAADRIVESREIDRRECRC